MSRREALAILEDLSRFSDYRSNRDFPSLNQTTKLSKYLKFGIVSPREVYYKIKENIPHHEGEALVRQLFWRDFFIQIGFHFPKVMEGKNFNSSYDKVEWNYDEDHPHYKQFCSARTGFPIVDAGIRELLETGYMHNRVRMITASFLTKDLHFHWTLGEKFFAKHLVDYDPLVNNSSWQWASSTGCDAQPYFRIFNPKLQQEKFDQDCSYIKKWIPELNKKSSVEIHNFEDNDLSPYPAPMINHFEEKEKTLKRFKVVKL